MRSFLYFISVIDFEFCIIINCYPKFAHAINFRVQDTRGGWIVFLPNFQEQTVWLILPPDLDATVGKYADNNEHKKFYVENLVPNQGKNHDLPPVGFSHFTITGKTRLQRNSPSYK